MREKPHTKAPSTQGLHDGYMERLCATPRGQLNQLNQLNQPTRGLSQRLRGKALFDAEGAGSSFLLYSSYSLAINKDQPAKC